MSLEVHFEIYSDAMNVWRWRLMAHHEKVLSVSAIVFPTREDCLKNVELIKGMDRRAPVLERKALLSCGRSDPY